jgi:hypothetical protein
MFIVIEGTDASGKSSLIAEIQKQLGANVELFHRGRPEVESRRWVLDEYVINVSNSYSLNRDKAHLSDRWHWGEVTYAPLKRPHTDTDGFGLLGVAGWRWVELFLLSRGITQFWLYQPLDVISQRLQDRGDDFVSVDELSQILDNYTKASKETASCLTLCPDSDSFSVLPELAASVIRIAREREQEANKLSKHVGYIGSPNPQVLLVGDKRNDKTVTSLPFMPVDSNSGDYLLSCLPDPFWKTIGIVNGDDINGKPLQLLWQALGHPRIVALGRMAEKFLKISGFTDADYNVVPHPQYVRRFHHHDRMEYGMAIERLSKQTTEQQGERWTLR